MGTDFPISSIWVKEFGRERLIEWELQVYMPQDRIFMSVKFVA
jgi:hypothetical protein